MLKRATLIIALLAAVLVLPTASAASTSLYLNDCKHATVSGSYYDMSLHAPDSADCTPNPPASKIQTPYVSDAVAVDGRSCTTWVASAPAATSVSFPKQGWSGRIQSVGKTAPDPTYDADIGYLQGGDLVMPNKQNGAVDRPELTIEGRLDQEIVGGSFTGYMLFTDEHTASDPDMVIPSGAYLAFRICGQGTSPTDLFVGTGGEGSPLTTPDGADPYPVPELGTLALLAIGLVGLTVVVARRRGHEPDFRA